MEPINQNTAVQGAATSSGAAAAGNAPGSGNFTPPEGQRLISESDYMRLSRAEANARGFQPWYDKARTIGIQRVEDFDEWAPVFKHFGENKITPKFLQSLITEEMGGGGTRQNDDARTVDVSSALEEAKRELRREMALAEFRRLDEDEMRLIEPFVGETLKDIQDEWLREIAADGLKFRAFAARKSFEDDHPLKGEMRPMSAKEFEEFKKAVGEARAKNKGAQLAAVGEAASRQAPRTGAAAGVSGGQGKPSEKDNNGRRRLSFQRSPQEDLEELNRLTATRGDLGGRSTVG